uniref:Uncharacterized protein n=1 Tax=Physcomitrium patens TaxID=3218 RepID=A0A7I4AD98_PHYPA|nr:uncharacterized protein LOC112289033 isoform X1 [Physcomitrium patens]|eukprot:XP_024389713.1 uncharacterized protein LOC112289033 isoform X1 [Physcomitrella patens]
MLLLERSPRTRINIVLGRLSWDCLIRGLATSFSSSPICATKIVLRAVPPSTPNLKALEVEFNNRDKYIYSAEFLCVKSSTVDSQRHSARGTIRIFLHLYIWRCGHFH